MLKASAYDTTYVLSTFISASVDKCWKMLETAETKNISTESTGAVSCVVRQFSSPEWMEEKLCRLDLRTISFKKNHLQYFQTLSIRMGIPKWRVLDPICNNIWEMSAIAYLLVGRFESSHKTFKKVYCFL